MLLLSGGRMVKPIRFGKDGVRDVGFPATTARIYDSQDADELILLNIEKAKDGINFLIETLDDVSKNCFVPITAGGGVRDMATIKELLRHGADKISINTYAIENPAFIKKAAAKFGRQCVVVSIDFKDVKKGRYEVFVDRGRKATGLELVEWAKKATELGAGELLISSIDKEGTMKGYDLEAIKLVSKEVNVPVIANGGAGTRDDCVLAVKAGAAATAASSLFHFSDSNLTQVKSFIFNAGVPIRPI